VFHLMEIPAVRGRHFVGFNTERWDDIDSVAEALARDPAFVNPNINAIGSGSALPELRATIEVLLQQ
jgi:malate synthase